MLKPAPAPWIVRGATFALWALAAGSAAYWGLKVAAAGRPVGAPAAAPRQVAPVDAVALARLLGSSPAAVAVAAPPALASRFQLLGVAAGAHSGGGAAVIAIDGKPPRSYRVGSTLEEGLVLQSVRGRQALIGSGDGKIALTLELPQQRVELTNRPLPVPVDPQAAAPQPGVPQQPVTGVPQQPMAGVPQPGMPQQPMPGAPQVGSRQPPQAPMPTIQPAPQPVDDEPQAAPR